VATAQRELELILMRRWASYVNLSMFIADAAGNLMYYNDRAAALLGRPFDEAGAMSVGDLDTIFHTTAEDGASVASADLPIHVALTERRPCHSRFRIAALDGQSRLIDVTALPLEGQGGRFLGAVAFFWEVVAS
jgi:PAS domain-containing protein